MVEFLIVSTTHFEHLSKRNIKLPQESDIIKFYERLYRAYKDVINDQTFSPNSNLDQALKIRLIQFSTNYNYTSVRPYIGANPEALRMTCQQLKNQIDRRQYTLKIETPISRTSRIQKKFNEYVKYWVYWTLALFGILSFWTSKKICPNSPGSIVYGCLDGFNDVPEASGRLKQYFDNSVAAGITDSVFFVFKGQKFFQSLNQTCSASRFPEALFISKSSLSTRESVTLLWIHISSIVEAHSCLFRNAVISNIFSELANFGVLSRLEELGYLRATLFSTSNIPSHHLSSQLSRASIKHHVYYSSVPTNPVQKNDKDPQTATLEPFLLMPINGTHWVWSEEDKWLLSKKYKQVDVRTGGVPALFFSNPKHNGLQDFHKILGKIWNDR